MTERELTCTTVDDLLADVVDGTLDPAAVASIEAHVSTCARCGPLVSDLRAIRQAASALPRVTPPPDAWPRILAALETERSHRRRAPWRPQLVAAAAVLVLSIGAALWSLWTTREPGERLAGARPEASDDRAADLVATVESEIELAATHYENAIAGLEEAARAAGTELDPAVVATLKTNLALVDQAIDDSRRALRTQPDNAVAQASLIDAFQRKVTLLQDTLALMHELRVDASATPTRLNEG